MCCYEFLLTYHFYQLRYIIFFDVHTNYLYYLDKIYTLIKKIIATLNSKW